MRKKLLGIAIVVCLTLSLIAIPFAGCAAPAPTTPTTPTATTPTPTVAPTTPAVEKATYQWELGIIEPPGATYYSLALRGAQMLADESDGRMQVSVYAGGLLGDWTTQSEGVALGTLDMYFGSFSQTLNPKVNCKDAAFMVRTWEDATKSYGYGGWLFDVFEGIGEECHIKFISFAMKGWVDMVSNVKWDPGDTGSKGIKMRVWPSPMPVAFVQALGFDPVSMPQSEVHSGLMLGTIDAMYGACGADDFIVYADAAKYLYAYHSPMGVSAWYMNLEAYRSMSKEDQAIIDKVGKEWGEYVAENYKASEDAKFLEVAEMYDEVIELTEEQWKINARAARPVIWPMVEKFAGKEVMDLIRANSISID